ncbi:hypothetical protein [Sphingobium vermicomposti]|uniref:Uncharacterized protein n=1 Tax=Sphingobium vermicomposti TaxID=529005 RepID=A0A846M724_9SPHN|nr:hypothetical protein [Sphingobium vermicomposti]NIJ16500.1 hypothetical protein [Sphingobium vermicomposti]
MPTTLARLMQNNPALQSPQQSLQQPMQEPQRQMSLADYLQAPLTNEPLKNAIMPGDQPGIPELPTMPGVKKPGAFSKDGVGWKVMGIVGDALQSMGGGRPTYMPYVQGIEEQVRQDKARLTEMQERARVDASKPDYFTVGRNRVRFDPTTQQSQTVYEAPADFEEYAGVLGLQPGTDEYNEAVQDYVLRSNGPTAQDGREGLEGVRQDNRVSLEAVRQGNRMTLRGMPTYANLHPRPTAGRSGGGNGGGSPRTTGNVYAPILAKIAAGKGLTPGEQQVIGMYGRGGRGGKPAAPSTSTGPVATDGKGNKVQWNGKAWVSVR